MIPLCAEARVVGGLVVKYAGGALLLICAVVALQRADRALSPGARGAATGAALLALVVLAEIRRRRPPAEDAPTRSSSSSMPEARRSLPSIHMVEIPYPKQKCAGCGFVIRKEREDDRAVLVAEPGRLRYYHRGCVTYPLPR